MRLSGGDDMERNLVDLIRAATALQAAVLAYHSTEDVAEIEAMHKCLASASSALRHVQTAHHTRGQKP